MRVVAAVLGFGLVGGLIFFTDRGEAQFQLPSREALQKQIPLLLALPLDGNVLDTSAKKRPVRLTGGAWVPGFDGKSPGALSFDGRTELIVDDADGYFNVPAFSLSLRFKSSYSTGGVESFTNVRLRVYTLVALGNPALPGAGSFIVLSGRAGNDQMAGIELCTFYPTQACSGNRYDWPVHKMNVPVDQWNQLKVVYDGTTVSLMVNGETKVSAIAKLRPSTTGLRIGGKWATGPLPERFGGEIDDVRFEQIQAKTTSTLLPKSDAVSPVAK
jgi:hypothetical protein